MFQYKIAYPICRQEIPFVSGRFLMSAGDTCFGGRSLLPLEDPFFGERSLLSTWYPFCQAYIIFVGKGFILLARDPFCRWKTPFVDERSLLLAGYSFCQLEISSVGRKDPSWQREIPFVGERSLWCQEITFDGGRSLLSAEYPFFWCLFALSTVQGTYTSTPSEAQN